MTGIRSLLARLLKFKELKLVFRFPYVNCLIVDQSFQGLSDEEREAEVAKRADMTTSELRQCSARGLLVVRAYTPEEFQREYPDGLPESRGMHWLGGLLQLEAPELPAVPKSVIRTVHFYGYKGGQARSTILAILATALADEGWRVLVVDSDVEAPSLDVLFGRSVDVLGRTLTGIAGARDFDLKAEIAYPETSKHGRVDYIPCRPSSTEYDLDAAAFALRTALDPDLLSKIASRLGEKAKEAQYDLIFVDHRTGLAPSVLPWYSALPGPTVFCAKMDSQWQRAADFVSLLFSLSPGRPGVIATWHPDDETERDFRVRSRAQVNQLLELIAEYTEAASPVDDDETDVSVDAVADHWVILPYERAFRTHRLPRTSDLSPLYNARLTELRRLLELGSAPAHQTKRSPVISISGARDEGWLIQTRALRSLLERDSDCVYVLGRKGTGKTRLARVLEATGAAEPLMVAPEHDSRYGLKASDSLIRDQTRRFANDPESFWWTLIVGGCQVADTSHVDLKGAWNAASDVLVGLKDRILESTRGANRRRNFLFDGLEVAFDPTTIRRFVPGLFRVLNTIQNDPELSEWLGIKLFVRLDLAEGAVENFAQQVENRVVNLIWDTQSFFNFLLSRVAAHEWFAKHFGAQVSAIQAEQKRIELGELTEDECLQFLLAIFPNRLRRANILTSTFFRTYFADSSSIGDQGGQYYPRVVVEFLNAIERKGTAQNTYKGAEFDLMHRVDAGFVEFAHEVAAQQFLKDVADELRYLLPLDDDLTENKQKVTELLEAFREKITPFVFKTLAAEISQQTKLDLYRVEESLRRMKQVGIFQDVGEGGGKWRAGQLFKSSLGMKFYRAGRRRRVG